MSSDLSATQLTSIEQEVSESINSLIQSLKSKYILTDSDLDPQFVETIQSLSLESFTKQSSEIDVTHTEGKQVNISYRYSDMNTRVYIPVSVSTESGSVEYTLHIYNKLDAKNYRIENTFSI